MIIIVIDNSGTKREFRFREHSAIDKMVAAIKENMPNWQSIEIKIESMTP